MKIKEHLIESACGEYTRKVWLLSGTQDEPQKLCVFLDAEYYLHRMDTPAILSDLQAKGLLPPVTCLFVSHQENAARHSDYACNPLFSRFLAEDLFLWVRATNEAISEEDNLICGLSLSGLASAYLALTYSQRFSRALCQSGSFWWNSEWLAQNMTSLFPTTGKFWLSVGDQEVQSGLSHPPSGMRQEVSQIAATETTVRALEAMGATIHYHLFAGGHEIAPWQQELPLALRWLIGTDANDACGR